MPETSGGEMMLHDGPFEEKAREQRGKKGEIGAKKKKKTTSPYGFTWSISVSSPQSVLI